MSVSFHVQHLKRVDALSFKPSLSWAGLSPARLTSSSEKEEAKLHRNVSEPFSDIMSNEKQVRSMLKRAANTPSPLFFCEQIITSFKHASGQARAMKMRRQGLWRTPH